MIQYIKRMLEELADRVSQRKMQQVMPSRVETISRELEGLSPGDFPPDQRFGFVELRRRLENYTRLTEEDWHYVQQKLTSINHAEHSGKIRFVVSRVELHEGPVWEGEGAGVIRGIADHFAGGTVRLLGDLKDVLDTYLGPDVRKARLLPFVRDPGLKKIAERDYHDLVAKLFPSEAWKSVVIHCGSILEAVLHDLLTRDPARVTAANTAVRAPQKQNAPRGTKRDITGTAKDDEWTLNDYIEVADELNLLPGGWKPGVQATVRNFRNYVHPRREIKAADQITQGEAFQALGMLMKVIDHIEARHP